MFKILVIMTFCGAVGGFVGAAIQGLLVRLTDWRWDREDS
jgi:hypothetical protein